MARKPVGLRLTGDKEIDKALGEMEGKLQLRLARKATKKAATDIILPEAKRRAPFKDGGLRASLVVRAAGRITKRQKRARQTGANKHVKQTFIGHLVQTKDGWFQGDQFYGGFVEFGTDDRSSGGANRGKIEKDKFAFLRPALYSNESRIKNLFISALKEFIRAQAKK